MNIKVKNLEKLYDGLQELDKAVLPVNITYIISHNQKILESECQAYQDQRNKLVIDCAKRDEKGEPKKEILEDGRASYKIDDIERFEYELGALLESEIDIDIRTVSLDDIEEAAENDKYTALSVKDMNRLDFMIDAD